MNGRLISAASLVIAAAAGIATQLAAYPGGTPRFVTNAAPYCTTCHSSVNVDQLRDLAPDAAAGMLPDKHHYAAISSGDRAYSRIEAGDRDKLLAAVKAMDANCKVDLAVSAAKVKPGASLTATVTTRGGAGPVVGVMLTDNDQRYQSSPVQVEGFIITQDPQVTGPDGKPQTKFLDGREAGLSRAINYVNIQDVKSDPDAGTYPECRVVYTLAAPATPGEYTISAAFLYGTEKASAIGRQESPDGRVLPAGGQGSGSGRIQFAKLVKITVAK
jgi:hypothetical protein